MTMKVELIASTKIKNHEEYNSSCVGYIAAKECYTPDYDFFDENPSTDKIDSYLKKVLNSGHHSIIEHASCTFKISGVSRVLTHQLVRHRIASYTQRSQRYSSDNANNTICPNSIARNETLKSVFDEFIETTDKLYNYFLDSNIPKEDARYILPMGINTSIYMTMNYRTLIHFLGLRCCTRAQWEIRNMANSILDIMSVEDPIIFGPNGLCNGAQCTMLRYCPEHNSCGRYENLKPTK